MDDMWTEVQYEEFCKVYPMTFDEWIRITQEWVDGIAEINPYPLDEKEAKKKIMEKLH